MAKSYPEQLGDWVNRRTSTRRDKNLVAFLAVRDDVRVAVDAGFAVKTVWANMIESKRVDFGYDTFLNYVNRLIRRPQVNQASSTAKPDATNTRSQHTGPPRRNLANPSVKASKAPDSIDGFTFNATPRKEDLL
jgi:hypothetical protein